MLGNNMKIQRLEERVARLEDAFYDLKKASIHLYADPEKPSNPMANANADNDIKVTAMELIFKLMKHIGVGVDIKSAAKASVNLKNLKKVTSDE